MIKLYRVTAPTTISGVNLGVGQYLELIDSYLNDFCFNTLNFDRKNYICEKCSYRQPISSCSSFLVECSPAEVQEYEVRKAKYSKENWQQFTNLRASHILGSDPELFAVDKDGVIIPAFKYLKPRKTTCYPLNTHPYYPDGFAAEFQTGTWRCVAYGVDRYYAGLKNIHNALKLYDWEAKLVADPLIPIPQQMLDESPAEFVQLGCSPSLNAYGIEGVHIEDGRQLSLRVSGSHIHVTLKKVKPEDRDQHIIRCIKMMDKLAGVLSVVALQGLESPIRRRYYGLPGEYRTPTYGFEYRTLSSAMLWHPTIVHVLVQFARAGVQLTEAGLDGLVDMPEDAVIRCLLDLDVDLAKKLILANRGVFERLLDHWYRNPNQPVYGEAPNGVQPSKVILEELLFKGFMQFIKLDIAGNWALDSSTEWKTHSEGDGVHFWKFVKKHLGPYEGKD